MRVVAVTSWADKDAETHGRRFLETYAQCWGPIPLAVYTDRMIETRTRYPLFLKKHGHHDIHQGSFIRGAAKWARKVFALEHAKDLWEDSADWLVWIDGDVEFRKPVDEEFRTSVYREDVDLVYLGREWAYASETGFVAYRIDRAPARLVIDDMARGYVSGEFLTRSNWGDGFAFDRAREAVDASGLSLSAHVKKRVDHHVWPDTILHPYMAHYKGPRRKKEAYG